MFKLLVFQEDHLALYIQSLKIMYLFVCGNCNQNCTNEICADVYTRMIITILCEIAETQAEKST